LKRGKSIEKWINNKKGRKEEKGKNYET